MSERGSVKRMTQIFLRKSELAFPVFGSQQTRSRIPRVDPLLPSLPPCNLLVTRSIESLACLQPAGLARSRESIAGIASRSSEKEQGNDAVELDIVKLLYEEEKHVLSPFPAENILTLSYMNYFSQREKIIKLLNARFLYTNYSKKYKFSDFSKISFF